MKPTPKHPDLNDFLTRMFGVNRTDSIEKNICTSCGKKAETFDSELSKKEYCISGLCQVCQDTIWRI